MSLWILLQIGLNLIFGIAVFLCFQRLNRPAKDDPRLSRGLQLLQSKIAILEDLSDRTEVQVSQLTALLEQKCKDVQSKIQQAERHVHIINATMEKSLDVAKIFQDKIPHQEIIERQNTLKYVQAARMAHQGMTIEQIREKIDLPLGELEFIIKVNREQLMFSEEDLPAWARTEGEIAAQEPASEILAPPEPAPELCPIENPAPQRDLSEAFEVQRPQLQSLEKLGEQFRKACEEYDQQMQALENQPSQLRTLAQNIVQPLKSMAENVIETASSRSSTGPLTAVPTRPGSPHLRMTKPNETIAPNLNAKKDPVIRKVEFPRIELPDELA